MKHKNKLKVFALAILMSVSSVAKAELVSVFDAINFKPAVDSSKFITLYDAELRPAGEWNTGFYIDWAHHPLELGTTGGTRSAGVLDDTVFIDIGGSYSFTNWFTVGARVPVGYYNYLGLTSTVARSLDESSFYLGDVALDFKFRLLKSQYVKLAVIPFVAFPTGKSTTFLGQGTVTGGGKIALDFDPHEKVKIGLNVGYRVKDEVIIRGADINDSLSAGLGVSWRVHDKISLIAEGQVEGVVKNLYSSEVQTPAEVGGAVRIHATPNLDVTVGGGAGLTLGVGTPDFRTFLGLNYTHHNSEEAPPPPVKKEIKKIVIDKVIYFNFDKSDIKKESMAILDDVASVLKSNPQIKKIRVESHTDAIGSEAYNQKLSQRRANSTVAYLVSKGVDTSRLEAVGYGKTRPIADNKTEAGRAQNRRSEFNVVEQ
ncbi:MAG: OmpA family protein [Deltaproteobacteria bacterium]|nr:OmpA family protein [Deltaproteobacteria bacterium]